MLLKHRWRLSLVLSLLLLIGGLLLLPSVRWPIYGWLRGEAFYQGMPASWWAAEIQQSYQGYFSPMPIEKRLEKHQPMVIWSRELPTTLEYRIRSTFGSVTISENHPFVFGPPLFDGDGEALPVLRQLVRNELAKVRLLAVSGLLLALRTLPADLIAVLTEMIHDEDADVRELARWGLRQTDPDAAAKAGIK